MRITVFITAILFFSILFLVACTANTPIPPTPTPTEHPGKALVTSRCATCHAIGVIENARNNQSGWEGTVDRMIINGAKINENQRAQIIDYLAISFPKD